jgi:glycosidase
LNSAEISGFLQTVRRVETFISVQIRFISILLLLVAPLTARPWSEDVMYFVMADRFMDGDPQNNSPTGSDPALYDPQQKETGRYQGGDLRGLEQALASGYFNDLGITALWLTPVVKNVWRSGYDLGGSKTGYHGYWTQDWLDIDPHLTSNKSLTGEAYSDDAEGRMKHYQDFIKLAHSKGIKVIKDVVLNHAGPVFYYDANENNTFDVDKKEEWIQPFKDSGFYHNAKWADVPKWNFHRTQPDGPRELLGAKIPTTGILSNLDAYGRKGFSSDSLGKSDGEEVTCDFFSLRDLWTAPDGKHFDALVDEFVTIYNFYLTTVGVDGLRIDTVKHVHHQFWDAFTARLRTRLGNAAAEKLLFGEIYDGNPEVSGRYTWPSDWPQNTQPVLDSVLDFNFCFTAREYLRQSGKNFGSPADLEKSLKIRTSASESGRPFYNPNPGPDGLNSQQKIITFIENHDGLNRFRVTGITERRNRLAQGLLLVLPGIPCLYYGAEASLLDEEGKIGEDGESGRMMFYKRKGGPSIAEVKNSPTFKDISTLAALRRRLPVLRTGKWLPLWVDSGESKQDDGIFAFARASEDGESFAVIAINASDESRVTSPADFKILLPAEIKSTGKALRLAAIVGQEKLPDTADISASGPLTLSIPPSSLLVYESVPMPPPAAP